MHFHVLIQRFVRNSRVEEEKISIITTQEYIVETPKSEGKKKSQPLSNPTTRELLLYENIYYNSHPNASVQPHFQSFKLSQIYKLKVLLTDTSEYIF